MEDPEYRFVLRVEEIASAAKGSTHGHAEDRLVGLVNFTLSHFEGCARR